MNTLKPFHPNVEEDKFDIGRYQVDSFKSTNMKRVPLDQLDFSIYNSNANLVASSSTEERLPIYIKAMHLRYKHGFLNDGKIISHWEEENNPNDPTKCDKVTITLRSQENEKYIVSITVMVNKGRIQIQGRFMKEWGSEEFPILIELINNPDLMKSNTAKNLNNFTAKTLSQRTTKQQTPATSRQPDHDHPIPLDSSINHSPKERPLINTVKTNLATLEADFIWFKQNTNKTITELSTTIFNKDIQIKNLENEIIKLKTGYSKNQQLSSDLSLRQTEMEEELKKMHHKCKSLEEKNSMLIGKLAALNENIESRINDDVTIESNSPASDADISTSNKFLSLSDESIIEEPTQKSPSKQQTKTAQRMKLIQY